MQNFKQDLQNQVHYFHTVIILCYSFANLHYPRLPIYFEFMIEYHEVLSLLNHLEDQWYQLNYQVMYSILEEVDYANFEIEVLVDRQDQS